ncbi:MAG: holin-like protein [Oleispira sp.]|jgi:holin-like protein
MSFINGLTILLFYQLIGEISVRWLGLPVPGPVLGMLMLFITLVIRNHVSDSLSEASTGLLSHLSLLFIPAGVGMMVHFDRIANEWLSISIALILSTLFTLMFSATVMLMMMKLKEIKNATN